MRTAFTVLRIQKLKTWGAIAAAGKHNHRERETPNSDASKAAKNQYLVGTSDMDNLAAMKKAIGDQRIRKNAVLGVEMLLSASPEFFRPGAPERAGTYDGSRLEGWKNASMNWLQEKYGNRIVSASLHLDEATPHLHVLLAPLDDRGKLNCRALFGGTRHTLSQLQSEYGAAVAYLGISRGIPNSRATHQEVSQFYALTQGKNIPELPFAHTYKSPEMPGAIARMSDAQLKQYEQKAALNGATAQKDADSAVIAAVHNKNVVLERENLHLKQENSKLVKEKTELQKKMDMLRGIEPGQVLTRLFAATGPYLKESQQYYILPGDRKVEVTNSRWKCDSKRGSGAIDLMMHLRGYSQHNMDKALGELAHAFGQEKVVGEVGSKAMGDIALTVKRAEKMFTPEEKGLRHAQGVNFSR